MNRVAVVTYCRTETDIADIKRKLDALADAHLSTAIDVFVTSSVIPSSGKFTYGKHTIVFQQLTGSFHIDAFLNTVDHDFNFKNLILNNYFLWHNNSNILKYLAFGKKYDSVLVTDYGSFINVGFLFSDKETYCGAHEHYMSNDMGLVLRLNNLWRYLIVNERAGEYEAIWNAWLLNQGVTL